MLTNFRDYFKLLHLPTTSCILAFAVIGSAFAPVIYLDRLLWILLYLFFIGAMAANYFDEIKGRPWHTTVPEINLWVIGLLAFFVGIALGIYLMLVVSWWFGVFTVVWSFLTLTYDLELFNGRFHNTSFLAISWGSICFGSYFIHNQTVTPSILIVSFIAGCIAGQGRNLYEMAKPFCKDKNPHSNTNSHNAWIFLKILIMFIDIVAVSLLVFRSIGHNWLGISLI